MTHLCIATPPVREKLLNGGLAQTPSDLRVLLGEILTFFASGYVNFFGMDDGPPLHDPLAVAALIPDSGIFEDEGERYVVTMATAGEHYAGPDGDLVLAQGQVGRTVVTKSATGKGVRIPRKLNVEAFWQTISDCCSLAEKKGSK